MKDAFAYLSNVSFFKVQTTTGLSWQVDLIHVYAHTFTHTCIHFLNETLNTSSVGELFLTNVKPYRVITHTLTHPHVCTPHLNKPNTQCSLCREQLEQNNKIILQILTFYWYKTFTTLVEVLISNIYFFNLFFVILKFFSLFKLNRL